MKSTTPHLFRRILMIAGVIAALLNCSPAISQNTAAKSARIPKMSADKMAIDSLKLVVDAYRLSLKKTDSLYDAEKFVSAELRDEILKLDDYRKKLEQNNQSFKGENLKLNQSNRILIIFNSFVAILLVTTLIFFLKRMSRKKTAEPVSKDVVELKNNSEPMQSTRFASFEDRLMQLERLGKLREKGLLSEAEFIAEKQKVLGK